MTDARSRLILWHKLIAQVTGSMSLCYGKSGLKRDEAGAWADSLENVAADIRNLLIGAPPILDGKGRRVVQSVPLASGSNTADAEKGKAHGLAVAVTSKRMPHVNGAVVRGNVARGDGPRIAKRRTI